MYIVIAIWAILGVIGWAGATHRNPGKRKAVKAFIPCILLGPVTFIAVVFFAKERST